MREAFKIVGVSNVPTHIASGNRKPFPYECTREWKRCTGHVMTDTRTRDPSMGIEKLLHIFEEFIPKKCKRYTVLVEKDIPAFRPCGPSMEIEDIPTLLNFVE